MEFEDGTAVTMENILQEWGLQSIIPTFIENEIDMSTLFTLSNEEIKELIPKMGPRKRFLAEMAKCFRDSTVAEETPSKKLCINNEDKDQETPSNKLCINYEDKDQNDNEEHSLPNNNYDESNTVELDNSIDSTASQVDLDCSLHDIPPSQIDLSPASSSQQNTSLVPKGVLNLLSGTTAGKFVLASFNKENKLNEQSRKKLVEIVVDSVINLRTGTFKVHNSEWQYLAKEIVSIFATENEQTYYVAPITEGPAQKISKGKLVDKWRNSLKLYRKSGIIPPTNKSANKTLSTNLQAIDTDPYEEDLAWLKYNRQPWPEVQARWGNTFPLRSTQYKQEDGKIDDIFKNWPILEHQLGYTLIEADFQKLFPERDLNLFTNFHTIFEKLLVSQKVADPKAKEILAAREQAKSQDCKDAYAIMLLAALCPPKTRIQTWPKGSWKPTIVESMEGLILQVKTPNDIKNLINVKREKMLKRGLPVQPYIIVVGSLDEAEVSSYVSIDTKLFSIDSPLKALDVCYKCIHVLNAAYPREAAHIWMFIQKTMYHMKTKWDREYPAVNAVISSL